MESALLKFLTRRQAFCKRALNVVYVESLGGGTVNNCFGNAYAQLRPQEVTIVRNQVSSGISGMSDCR